MRIEAEYGDGAGLWAGEEADAAAGAPKTSVDRREIAIVIEVVVEMQDLGRTGFDAEAATLALIAVHVDEAAIGLSGCGRFLHVSPPSLVSAVAVFVFVRGGFSLTR